MLVNENDDNPEHNDRETNDTNGENNSWKDLQKDSLKEMMCGPPETESKVVMVEEENNKYSNDIINNGSSLSHYSHDDTSLTLNKRVLHHNVTQDLQQQHSPMTPSTNTNTTTHNNNYNKNNEFPDAIRIEEKSSCCSEKEQDRQTEISDTLDQIMKNASEKYKDNLFEEAIELYKRALNKIKDMSTHSSSSSRLSPFNEIFRSSSGISVSGGGGGGGELLDEKNSPENHKQQLQHSNSNNSLKLSPSPLNQHHNHHSEGNHSKNNTSNNNNNTNNNDDDAFSTYDNSTLSTYALSTTIMEKESRILANLGTCYQKTKEFSLALKNYFDALRVRKQLLSIKKEQTTTSSSSNNNNNNTNPSEAPNNTFDKNWTIALLLDIARLFHNVGLVQMKLKKLDKSLVAFKKAMKLRCKWLGKKNLTVMSTYNCIGDLYFFRGDYSKAMNVYTESLEIQKLLLGDHLEVANTQYNLALVNIHLKQYEKALGSLKHTLRIRKNFLRNKNDLLLGTCLHALGVTYYHLENYDDAMINLKSALEIRKANFGEQNNSNGDENENGNARGGGRYHLSIANTLLSIAMVLHRCGKVNPSLQTFQQVLNIRKMRLGEEHESVGATLKFTGDAFGDFGLFANAIKVYEHALYILRLHNTEEDYDITIADILDKLGKLYGKAGQPYEKSASTLVESLKIKRAILGKEDLSVASTLKSLGDLYLDASQYDPALRAYEEVIRVRKKHLSENHMDIADVFNNIGNACFKKHDYGKALGAYSDAFRIKRTQLNQDNHSYLTTLMNLGHAHFKRGNLKKALKAYKRCLDTRKRKLRDMGLLGKEEVFVVSLKRICNQLKHSEEISDNDKRTVLQTLEIIASTLYNIGLVHQAKDENDHALEAFVVALQVRKAQPTLNLGAITVLTESIGLFHYHKGQYEESLAFFFEVLTIKREHQGRNHLTVSYTLNNIGNVLFAKGDYDEAMVNYQESLTIKRLNLGRDHIDVANTLNNIGNILYTNGHYIDALSAYLETLQIKRSQLSTTTGSESSEGETHTQHNIDVASSLKNVGDVHTKLEHYEEANQVYQQAHSILKSCGLERSVESANILFSLAFIYEQNHQYVLAIETIEQELKIREELHERAGGDSINDTNHPSVARCYFNMGRVHYAIGNLDHALRFYQQSLYLRKLWIDNANAIINHQESKSSEITSESKSSSKSKSTNSSSSLSSSSSSNTNNEQKVNKVALAKIRKKQLGEMANILHRIGVVQQDRKNFHEAVKAFQEALKLRKLLFGNEHLSVGITLETIGIVYFRTLRYKESKKAFSQSLRIKKMSLGKDHEEVATTLNSIANVYFAMRQYQPSMESYQKALEIKILKLGEDHEDVATLYGNIAGAHFLLMQDELALQNYEKCLEIKRKRYGEHNIQIAATLIAIGDIHFSNKNIEKALEHFELSLKIKQQCLTTKHLELSPLYEKMGHVFSIQRNWKKAQSVFIESVLIKKHAYGESHLETAKGLELIATAHYEQAHFREAIVLLSEVLRVRRLHLAPNDAAIINTLNKIGKVHKKNKDINAAVQAYQEAERLKATCKNEQEQDDDDDDDMNKEGTGYHV